MDHSFPAITLKVPQRCPWRLQRRGMMRNPIPSPSLTQNLPSGHPPTMIWSTNIVFIRDPLTPRVPLTPVLLQCWHKSAHHYWKFIHNYFLLTLLLQRRYVLQLAKNIKSILIKKKNFRFLSSQKKKAIKIEESTVVHIMTFSYHRYQPLDLRKKK